MDIFHSMKKSYDIAIIGASLAGASLALRLAPLGLKILIIDSSSFPRRKPCGEGLSNLGLLKLYELGLSERITALKPHQFKGYTVWLDSKSYNIPFSSESGLDYGKGIGIERYKLDLILLESLQRFSGAEIRLNAKLRAISGDIKSCYSLSIENESYNCKRIVLADGARSLSSELLGLTALRTNTGRHAVSMCFEGDYQQPVSDVHVSLFDGHEMVVTPLSGDRINLCLLGSKQGLKSKLKIDGQSALKELVYQRTGFVCRERIAMQGVTNIAGLSRPVSANGALLIGDALETLDPIGGMGMSHALISAAVAAQLLKLDFFGELSSEEVIKRYRMERERAARPLRGFTRLTYFALKRSPSGVLFNLLNHSGLAHRLGATVNQQGAFEQMPQLKNWGNIACEALLNTVGA